MPEVTNFLALLMAVLVLPGCLPATAGRGLVPLAADLSLLVTVGDVTDSTAVLWLRGQSPGIVHLRYGPVGRREETMAQVLVTPAADLTGKVLLAPLAPSTRYRYLVEQGAGRAEGEFVTAPPAGQGAEPAIALFPGRHPELRGGDSGALWSHGSNRGRKRPGRVYAHARPRALT